MPVLIASAASAATPNFRNDIQPILAKFGCSSGACHGAAAGKNGFKLSLRGYDPYFDHDAVTREAGGRRVVRSEPASSLILLKPTNQVKHGGGERFTADSPEYKLIQDWIAAGAPGPKDSDAHIDRIEVLPDGATLKVGDTHQTSVRAHYNDGSVRDVTRWAKFSTSDDGVAKVSEEGLANIVSPGEAVINVWFDSKVAGAHLSAPFPNTVDPKVYAESPKSNFIDEHILAKLKTLNIPPSGRASDATFIRRASLDAAGILPKPEEVTAFVADAAPDKRAKLIDRLLQRKEFADYWAYKLSDLLLLSSEKLKEKPALLSFYQFIRDSIEKNKPWDQFVRDILTARGSNLDNGAVNYFLIHKETTSLSETTSLAFMGLSIGCAKCHNHPLEKWTLNDYYGMANLFSRVKVKDGDRPGEVVLQAATFGNVNNLVTGKPMPPKPLDGEQIPLDATADRREHLARWLTAPDNPYFTKSIVNRVWKNFMGRGLVEPEDDLRDSNPVSIESLMPALCKDLVEHKYDLRHLMRMIMSSAAYQRAAESVPGNEGDTKYYARYIVHRLSAEALLDGYAQVTGIATPFPGYPAGWRSMQLPDSKVASYFLDTFGRPERKQTCSCERTDAASITQALHVSNGNTLNEKLRAKGGMIDRFLDEKLVDDAVVSAIYMTALSRAASEEEKKIAVELLSAPTEPDADGRAQRRERIEDVLWAVLTSKEFVFNH